MITEYQLTITEVGAAIMHYLVHEKQLKITSKNFQLICDPIDSTTDLDTKDYYK